MIPLIQRDIFFMAGDIDIASAFSKTFLIRRFDG